MERRERNHDIRAEHRELPIIIARMVEIWRDTMSIAMELFRFGA
jgi:hypothetical protein